MGCMLEVWGVGVGACLHLPEFTGHQRINKQQKFSQLKRRKNFYGNKSCFLRSSLIASFTASETLTYPACFDSTRVSSLVYSSSGMDTLRYCLGMLARRVLG